MKLKSVEFSTSFLESIADLSEDAREGLLSSLEFQVFETAEDPATIFARDPGIVGRLVLDSEDIAPTFFALKRNSD